FSNPLLERREISSFLKGKTGIYMFLNKQNGKFYIGSGVNMSRRLNYYFQNCFFKYNPNSIIGKAILKYGMENFCLVILEFCDKENLLSRETHFISTSDPAYNILKIAGNLLGFKHKHESILKIGKSSLGRIHSAEIRAKISESQKTRFQFFRPLGFAVSVLDLVNNSTTDYLSIAQAAKELGLNPSSISQRMKKGITSAFKGRYVITVKRSEFD
ncbi:GIY-YIG endonuclease family protein, partial (mitochondrion) [Rhizoctonia solani 123E]